MGGVRDCDNATASIRDVATSGGVGRTNLEKLEGKGCNVEWGE